MKGSILHSLLWKVLVQNKNKSFPQTYSTHLPSKIVIQKFVASVKNLLQMTLKQRGVTVSAWGISARHWKMVDYTYQPTCIQHIHHCIFICHNINITAAAVARDGESPAVLGAVYRKAHSHLHFKQTWFRAAWLREPKAVAVSHTSARAYTSIWCSIGQENHTSTINKPCYPHVPSNGSCLWVCRNGGMWLGFVILDGLVEIPRVVCLQV